MSIPCYRHTEGCAIGQISKSRSTLGVEFTLELLLFNENSKIDIRTILTPSTPLSTLVCTQYFLYLNRELACAYFANQLIVDLIYLCQEAKNKKYFHIHGHQRNISLRVEGTYRSRALNRPKGEVGSSSGTGASGYWGK